MVWIPPPLDTSMFDKVPNGKKGLDGYKIQNTPWIEWLKNPMNKKVMEYVLENEVNINMFAQGRSDMMPQILALAKVYEQQGLNIPPKDIGLEYESIQGRTNPAGAKSIYAPKGPATNPITSGKGYTFKEDYIEEPEEYEEIIYVDEYGNEIPEDEIEDWDYEEEDYGDEEE